MDVVVIGAGSHGHDCKWIAEAAGFRVVEMFDDEVRGLRPVMSAHSISPTIGYVLGFNSPTTRQRFDYGQRVAPSIVHPTAFVGPNCELDAGSVVAPMACLANGVVLGRHVHVNAGTTLVRVSVGNHSTIAPGVHVGGDVTIGAGVFVGIGARVANLVTIGDGATIGAGAVVIDDVPAGATVVGVPARQLESVRVA